MCTWHTGVCNKYTLTGTANWGLPFGLWDYSISHFQRCLLSASKVCTLRNWDQFSPTRIQNTQIIVYGVGWLTWILKGSPAQMCVCMSHYTVWVCLRWPLLLCGGDCSTQSPSLLPMYVYIVCGRNMGLAARHCNCRCSPNAAENQHGGGNSHVHFLFFNICVYLARKKSGRGGPPNKIKFTLRRVFFYYILYVRVSFSLALTEGSFLMKRLTHEINAFLCA